MDSCRPGCCTAYRAAAGIIFQGQPDILDDFIGQICPAWRESSEAGKDPPGLEKGHETGPLLFRGAVGRYGHCCPIQPSQQAAAGVFQQGDGFAMAEVRWCGALSRKRK
jgi:hypothetical protein